jgi:hypothetical protein
MLLKIPFLYCAVHPPSTINEVPVIKLDSSDAMKSAAEATSSGFPGLPGGILLTIKAHSRWF